MINLHSALRLAKLLDPYIPANPDLDAPILDFVGKILDRIVETGNHADYLASVEIMTGVDVDTLVTMSTEQVFRMFADGLIENKILLLIDIYRDIGTKTWLMKPSL